ncbi:MAG: preprotein translocase subunit YajC [Cyclobacteriaceae bacterium]
MFLQAPGGDAMQTLFLLGGMAIIFYFFMIRPQQKKSKDQRTFVDQIKKGDNVVTIGGIHGKVFSVDAETVTVEVDRGYKITVEKTAISFENSRRASDKPVKKEKD